MSARPVKILAFGSVSIPQTTKNRFSLSIPRLSVDLTTILSQELQCVPVFHCKMSLASVKPGILGVDDISSALNRRSPFNNNNDNDNDNDNIIKSCNPGPKCDGTIASTHALSHGGEDCNPWKSIGKQNPSRLWRSRSPTPFPVHPDSDSVWSGAPASPRSNASSDFSLRNYSQRAFEKGIYHHRRPEKTQALEDRLVEAAWSSPGGNLDLRCQTSCTAGKPLEADDALAPHRYSRPRMLRRRKQSATPRSSTWWWVLIVWILGCNLPGQAFAQTEQITWIGGSATLNVGTGTSNSYPAARARPNMFWDSQTKLIYIFGGEGTSSGTRVQGHNILTLDRIFE